MSTALQKPPTSRARREKLWRDLIDRRRPFASLYLCNPLERIELVKAGIPSQVLVRLGEDMAIPREKLYETLGLARATVNRKLRHDQLLDQDESERVLGLARLIGQVETVVRESGNPEGFDAARWVARWLDQPQQALGGRRPADLMDTADGRGLVSDAIARMQSAAYA